MKKIYVGPKKKTIENSYFFDDSVTLFQEEATFEYWNPDNTFLEISIYNKGLQEIIGPAEVMAHNPDTVSKCIFPSGISLICQNDLELLKNLNNKIYTRELFKNSIPMLEYITIKGKEFDYCREKKYLSNFLVIQSPIGSGGSKTFLCHDNNYNQVVPALSPEENYSVSVYRHKNIPYNVHCIIASEQIEIFPPSIQLLEISDKIEYIGSDYEIELSYKTKQKMILYSTNICKKLQKMGYRGILGIDYIYVENELYFIEINPRFQGSSRQLDGLLISSDLPSIFDYNYRSFYDTDLPHTQNMIFSIYK